MSCPRIDRGFGGRGFGARGRSYRHRLRSGHRKSAIPGDNSRFVAISRPDRCLLLVVTVGRLWVAVVIIGRVGNEVVTVSRSIRIDGIRRVQRLLGSCEVAAIQQNTKHEEDRSNNELAGYQVKARYEDHRCHADEHNTDHHRRV